MVTPMITFPLPGEAGCYTVVVVCGDFLVKVESKFSISHH